MRLASLQRDGWDLRSAEEAHREHPDTFWIPSLEVRRNLRRGHGAKLLFRIAASHDEGGVELAAERMWVVVSERVGESYLGRLVNEPESRSGIRRSDLRIGDEVAFGPQHIADVDEPPEAYVKRLFEEPPRRRWR